jgi:hypothetical protein
MRVVVVVVNWVHETFFFMSKRALRKDWSKKLNRSPSLRQLQAETGLPVRRIVELRHDYGRSLLALTGGVLVALIAQSVALNILARNYTLWNRSSVRTATSALLQILVLIVFTILAERAKNNSREDTLALVLVRVIASLEKSPDSWQRPKRRRRLNRQIEHIASSVAELPLDFGIKDRATLRRLLDASSKKAQGIRELQVWVAQPAAFTFTDLIAKLVSTLEKVLAGKWYELEDGPPMARISTTRRILWILLAIASLIAFFAVQIWGAKNGQVASLVSSLLGVVLLVGLGQLGVTPASISELLETTKKLPRADAK